MDEYDKGRWIINAFTRMRFCTAGGEMDFTHVGPPGTQPDGLFPWFQLLPRLEHRIIFGHWSLLGSGVHGMNVSLDSGCAHGGRLTAIDLDEDPVRFVQVSCTSR
jgi:bis(5'-nucleosyl)-tetraphosphatase (symmetrical)